MPVVTRSKTKQPHGEAAVDKQDMESPSNMVERAFEEMGHGYGSLTTLHRDAEGRIIWELQQNSVCKIPC